MKQKHHAMALGQAFMVTVLWSVSTLVAAREVERVAPLRLAGLSCAVAFLALLPLALRDLRRSPHARLTFHDTGRLAALGLCQYGLATGGQFLALQALPPTTVRLLLALTPAMVAVGGLALLTERPTWRQWAGLAACLVGALGYFSPWEERAWSWSGVIFGLLGTAGAAGGNLLARAMNRERRLSPAVVTTVSVGLGAALLLALSALQGGSWSFDARQWAAVTWLGVVNTAAATLLLNLSLRTLSALEVSVVLNTVVVQVALLAWLTVRQPLRLPATLGLLVVMAGAVLVQLPTPGRPRAAHPPK